MEKHTSKKLTIKICTLGEFSLTVGRVTVSETINRSNRIWNLLAYMLMHRNKPVTQTELIEAIWPEDESNNPGNTLKTLIYRVRGMLSEAFGDDFQLIVSQRGAYSLNSSYQYILDIDEYERLVAAAGRPEISEEERFDYYARACSLYKGDFIPRLSTEMWVIPISMHYHTAHLHLVKTYAELLFEAGRYKQVVDLCNEGIRLDAYDENLHALIISAYARQGNETAAISHYQTATDMLYRNLGIRPSETLRDIYLEIMEGSRNLETDLSIITDSIREKENAEGAFVCDYGFFRAAYRLESRRAARAGICVHVALITVSTITGSLPPLDVLNDTMDQLLDILTATLRKG
ncbi:MAG: hypothetical protein GX823_03340, partial [Clostridiales bacterium]|nr:hypothetical protein [Clostridiales bacterium]